MFRISRANFLPASLIAYFIGVAYAYSTGYKIDTFIMLIGFLGVGAAHLSGNLFNEYFDYKNGADKNSPSSPFSGGSKLIDKGEYKPNDVLKLAAMMLIMAFLCCMVLLFKIKSYVILLLALVGGILLLGYTAPPLKLAYRKWGEADIFFSFGVILVMGGNFIFSRSINAGVVLISLPIAFLITAVILCNEIPDYETDRAAKKFNLIHMAGKSRGWVIYLAAVIASYISILINIAYGNLPVYFIFSGALYLLGVESTVILRNSQGHLSGYIKASSYTVMLHAIIGSAIILSLVLGS